MPQPPVVTLFEKYGAGARYIGPRVADALGVEWMDQAFSSADIESAKYPGGGRAGDQGSGLARFLGRFAPSATVLDDASIPLAQAQDAEMVEENTRIVKEAGARGVVMLGRIARAAKEEGLDLTHATRRQRNEDWARAEMSEKFYYWNPMSIDRYDLVVNTGVLDLDTAVDVIVSAYRAKAARTTQTT
jgi:hypothetical protein